MFATCTSALACLLHRCTDWGCVSETQAAAMCSYQCAQLPITSYDPYVISDLTDSDMGCQALHQTPSIQRSRLVPPWRTRPGTPWRQLASEARAKATKRPGKTDREGPSRPSHRMAKAKARKAARAARRAGQEFRQGQEQGWLRRKGLRMGCCPA